MTDCEDNKAKTFFQYTKGSDWGQWVAFTWEGGFPFGARYGETLSYVVFGDMFDLDFSEIENKVKASIGMLAQTSLLMAGITGLVTLGNLGTKGMNAALKSPMFTGSKLPSGSMFSGQTPYKGWFYETHFFRYYFIEEVKDQVIMLWSGADAWENIRCVMMWFFCILPYEFGLLLSGSYLAAFPFAVVHMIVDRLRTKGDKDKQMFGWLMVDASIFRLAAATDTLKHAITTSICECSPGWDETPSTGASFARRLKYWAILTITILYRLVFFAVGPAFFYISFLVAALYYTVRIIAFFACFKEGKTGTQRSGASAFAVEAPRGSRAHPPPPQYTKDEEEGVSETDSLTTTTTKFAF